MYLPGFAHAYAERALHILDPTRQHCQVVCHQQSLWENHMCTIIQDLSHTLKHAGPKQEYLCLLVRSKILQNCLLFDLSNNIKEYML